MTLHTDKNLKSKKFRGQKCIYILAKNIDSKINFKSKPKNVRLDYAKM